MNSKSKFVGLFGYRPSNLTSSIVKLCKGCVVELNAKLVNCVFKCSSIREIFLFLACIPSSPGFYCISLSTSFIIVRKNFSVFISWPIVAWTDWTYFMSAFLLIYFSNSSWLIFIRIVFSKLGISAGSRLAAIFSFLNFSVRFCNMISTSSSTSSFSSRILILVPCILSALLRI